ncbi:Protein regulator of cytokinesis 1 isoform 2 [Schistosoma japonicum]|uniref:Protein regulator of cytokinesis 1 isoform 2 n=1 Tax=Schistosoma japonicum TaxID=6182 RepID=A0A4Z2DW78_SCHJA|nr:Protein regulator of cytokinesis 1 isoform 2 [Schistosoma japonicum]
MCASLSVSNILKCVEKKCLSILSVWNEIGVEGSELDEKMDSVINQIEVLLERILADQRAKKMQLSQSIEELITSIREISLELNNTPFDPPKTATLLELYNFLLTKKDKLLKDAKDYIQKFNLLKDLEKKLCSRLCEAEITLVYKVIPSQEQMTLLSRRVEHLNLLKAERITKFLELRSQMIAGYEKLGKPLRLVSDSCCLVKDILAPEALETFTLSEENMFSMADIVDQLASDCARVDTECNVYRDRLNLLVNLLNPLGITCDIIENENSNLTLLKLRTEVDRLEGLRTRHLDTLISTAQSQVYQCWDDCFVGEEHRQKFKFFIQNKDSKDVLSILEKEIITWKDFKKSNSEFIIDIIKWCEQFSSLQSLKKRMKEPSVLQNRGGILLKLEKERKQYSRDLPCLEGRVKEAFFNLCSTSPSLSSVIRLGSENLNPVDFIQKSWENLQNDKENEKPIVCIPKSAKNTEAKPLGVSNNGKSLKRPNPECNETIMSLNYSSSSSASSVIAERQAKQSRVVGNFPKKPELIKSKIDSRRRSRSVPPGGQKVIFPKVVMQQDKPTTSKNVLDDMNLYAKSSLTKQSVSEVDSFFEGLKGSSKVPHVSTFIQ